jgi:hypothetical protein
VASADVRLKFAYALVAVAKVKQWDEQKQTVEDFLANRQSG